MFLEYYRVVKVCDGNVKGEQFDFLGIATLGFLGKLCKDRQGGGLGTQFLRQIEQAVKLHGVEHLFLQTSEDVPAYRFYQKNGFVPLQGHVSLTKQL